jgi:hypothetical protein
MTKFIALALSLLFAATATAVPIDISGASAEITGATTMTLHDVDALGGNYWLDLNWDEGRNVFAVADYGEEPPSMVGRWTIGADWGGEVEIFMIQFNEDGTLTSVDQGDGTWTQTGYDVEWDMTDSEIHFEGTIAEDGEYASGTMSDRLRRGTWSGGRGW